MRILRVLAAFFVAVGVLASASESPAVIYKYLDKNGAPAYADDLTKVPEQDREKAVIVTGREEQELTDDAERARALAARNAVPDRQFTQQHTTDTFLRRLVRSGVAVFMVAAVFFVMVNIDALKEKETVVRTTRIALAAALVLFIGFTHARDVIGLFGSVGEKVSSPVTGIKEKQAAKGKQAAEAYKNIDQALQEKVQQEVDRVQLQFDEAERGK